MRKLTLADNRAKLIASIVAVLATTVLIGGPLSLAEHYARTGVLAAAATTPAAVVAGQQAQLGNHRT